MNNAAELELQEQFVQQMHTLIDYSRHLETMPAEQFQLSRPLLNFIKGKSEQAEEMLDAFGARNNTRWFPLREIVALLKNFSNAAYELLHIQQAFPFYSLENQKNFLKDSQAQVDFVRTILYTGLRQFAQKIGDLGILPAIEQTEFHFQETPTLHRLARDRRPQGSNSVKHRIDFLAIHILNSTEEVNQYRHLARTEEDAWESLDFDFLCEATLRTQEVNMHVLQAMYDTYISDSATENQDSDLYKLRGRISATLHLLRIATLYMHFFERHIAPVFLEKGEQFVCQDCLDCINRRTFAHAMLKYFANYLALFLTEARTLCSTLLRKYCVNKTVEVKAPPYIGFHVRPSSLVAAIVMHYGCNVEMRLGESVYDASIFANIAMANNYLDQKKRTFISQKIAEMDLTAYERQIRNGIIDTLTAVKEILLYMASQNLIKIYASPLVLDALPAASDAPLKSQVFESVKYLMNTDRQIGIVYQATVQFTGPEQAVDDIAALAQANYAESERGEDLPLPKQLDYLNFRRKTIRRSVGRN